MQSVRFGLATVVVVALLIVIGVAGWQFGWWLEAKNVDRQVQIDNTQKGTQQAWQDQVLADIRDASLAAQYRQHPVVSALEEASN